MKRIIFIVLINLFFLVLITSCNTVKITDVGNPDIGGDTIEVLEGDNRKKDEEINRLNEENKRKDDEISRLNEENKRKDEEISRLKEELNNSGSDSGGVVTDKPTSFIKLTPFYEITSSNVVKVENAIKMGGKTYSAAITYNPGYMNRSPYSLHNLDGKYRTIFGYIGKKDGSNNYNVTFNFYGDGTLIDSYDVYAQDLPIKINVDVTGVTQLKIESIPHSWGWSGSTYYCIADATIE